jgi:hypothetical protein
MPLIFLHIGTHKTGTTSIQYLIGTNREALMEQGIYQPVAGKPGLKPGNGNHRLAWGVLKRKGVTDLDDWNDLRNELQNCGLRSAVISSEAFCHMNEKEIEQVRHLLEAYEVYPVVYLRNCKSYLRSVYAEVIKDKKQETRSFKRYILENISKIDYDYLLEIWGKLFGYDHLIVRLYDKVSQDGGLTEDFSRIIGFNPSGLVDQAGIYRNVSYDDSKINSVRLLHKFRSITPDWLFGDDNFSAYKKALLSGRMKFPQTVFSFFAPKKIMKRKHARLIEALVKQLPSELIAKYTGEEGIKVLHG